MGWLTWIVLGLVAGIIAKFLMPGRDPGGFIITIVIGILGGVVGGWIGERLGYAGVTGFNLGSIIFAVIGAVLLLFVYRLLRGRA
ncbi:GlsB/YeaQ/YmgE family stress response membrane protein [Dongia sedimenti]|uniref:GlsB/YeaQ/YmgE family stress response membrane protein n=1 Tax=Dongia sedimenti TaxID=3064282 RepID=A0ABU0YFV6_9PROT|nr:GlsB/YeaQ/YmgE family stress response membrane protein [Rhodospirillaceae bacterium R-7]